VPAQPWANLVLSGAASADTLRSNLRAAEIAWTEELERRLAPLQEDTDRYWGRRAELVWN
jgi:aryl-alcohol dehydrogenase-like predicted oxidoreductase